MSEGHKQYLKVSMGAFAKWLLQDEQNELFDYLFAIVLNAIFLLLIALLLWPLGKTTMAWRLTKGFWIFWIVVIMTGSVLALVHRLFRMDLYSRFDAYVITALVMSGFVQAGWSAFAAQLVQSFAVNAPIWISIIMYAAGGLSCYVASVIIAAFYKGSLYRLMNPILAIVSFIAFSVWPGAGAFIYGWFFNLFA